MKIRSKLPFLNVGMSIELPIISPFLAMQNTHIFTIF